MDKYEYSIKSDKIKKLVERKDYETAVKIADTIDWERVRNIKMLSTVSLAYEKVSRFEEAKDLLLMAYECAPVGRRFLYKLTELATKQGEFDEAEQYLKEFAATSPQDPSRLVLRYEIAQAKGEPTERLITILEAYQKREFEEKWTYELANLYYRAGKNEECVKLCDEIVLWFGVGTYVDKAMELKQRIAPLTPDQIEKRENKEKYLRRLEEVQREFEEKYRVLEEPTVKAVEEAVQAVREPEVAMEAPWSEQEAPESPAMDVEATEPVEESAEPEAVCVEEPEMVLEEIATEPAVQEVCCAENAPEEEAFDTEDSKEEGSGNESSDVAVTEAEVCLAREIEAATLTAALNEVMLRETAVSMEGMEVMDNDHSLEHESTKVAMVRVPMHEKTREFVREAKAIRVVLEEVRDRNVLVEEVEERLEQTLVEEVPMAEEVSVEKVPVVEEASVEEAPVEEVFVDEAPVVEEALVEEVSVEEVSVEEEPAIEEVSVEETPAVAEVPVEETPVAAEISVEEAPVAAEISVEEAPAAEEKPVEEAPAVTEFSVEEVPVVEEIPVEAVPEVEELLVEEDYVPTTQDHYVLVACAAEEEGVKESVSYIRTMREQMGYPVTQVAKITGEKLATKNMAQTLRKLQGRDLVVTNVGQMPDGLLLQTVELMAQDDLESFIALIGNGRDVAELRYRQPFFADCHVIACGVEIPEVEEVMQILDAQEEEPECIAVDPKELEKAISSYYIEETTASREESVLEDEQSKLARMVEEALRATSFGGAESGVSRKEEVKPSVKPMAPSAKPMSLMDEVKAALHVNTEMTPKDFYECAVRYANMMDAKVDDMGGLAIYAVAEEYQQERQPLTEELAQELVEKAVVKAERRTLKSLFSNRYDKEGFLILKEQHFKD